MEEATSRRIELTASDQSQLGLLQKFLSQATPDAEVSRIAGQPNAGTRARWMSWL